MHPDQLRVLPSDDRHRMRVDALAGAIESDQRHGRRPFFVSASAGSTNTGAIDALPELAAICQEAGAWLHVDAAYGGFVTLTERGKRWLEGIEQADSVTLDPHKWLYQPFECGCVLVRDGELLRRAFEVVPDYLKDAVAHSGRGELLGPRVPADAVITGAEGVAVASATSGSTRSGRRSTGRSTSPPKPRR